jgi:hypothetical protein
MKNIRGVSLKLILVLLPLACVRSASPEAPGGDAGYSPPPSFYYCMANPSPKTEYFSGLFPVLASTAYNSISTAFKEFVTSKYGNAGNVACFGDPDQQKALKKMQQMSKPIPGNKVVETGWTYKPAPGENNVPSYNPHGSSQPLPSYNPHGNPTSSAHSNAQEGTASHPHSESESNPASAINGVYTGTYACAKGPIDLKLTLNAPEYGLLTATFTFYLPPGSHTRAYTFSLNGHFDPKSGSFNLNPMKWEGPEPPNYMMVGLKGAVDTQAGKVSGIIDYAGCGRFEAMKGRDD